MTRKQALSWTIAQTAIFWSVFLWVLPKGIIEFERKLGLITFHHELQSLVAACLFIVASILGLWSAVTMASLGPGFEWIRRLHIA